MEEMMAGAKPSATSSSMAEYQACIAAKAGRHRKNYLR